MSTLVCFHAHPDDESITTGGVIAKYATAGHRVVIVTATGGEHGEAPEDLAPGETLADRRRRELEASAAALGASRVVMLGYEDSGMTGWDQNTNGSAFANADIEEAAERLATILREEDATTVTVYDWHGNYGHPDHVKVHHVGHRAAEIAGTPHVYEATTNRDQIRRMIELARAAGMEGMDDFDADGPADDGNPMGTPESELTTAVDVSAFLPHKRASIACHASQISDTSFFLELDDMSFAAMASIEWFIRRGAPAGIHESELAGME
jgi:LmbE family N-acetylglucosaminyl deacetylase